MIKIRVKNKWQKSEDSEKMRARKKKVRMR